MIFREKFLYIKASEKGKDVIFEKDNTDKYDAFKKNVKSQIVKSVNNIDQIASVVHSHLNCISNDEDLNLIGLIRPSKDKDYAKLYNENLSLKKQLQTFRNKSNQNDSRVQIKVDEYKQRYLDILAKHPKETLFDFNGKTLL